MIRERTVDPLSKLRGLREIEVPVPEPIAGEDERQHPELVVFEGRHDRVLEVTHLVAELG